MELAWCSDIPGETGVKAGRETLVFALRERPEGLVSFGLGGPEPGVGRARFGPFFTRAREAGLHTVLHTGETTGSGTAPASRPTPRCGNTVRRTGSRLKRARRPDRAAHQRRRTPGAAHDRRVRRRGAGAGCGRPRRGSRSTPSTRPSSASSAKAVCGVRSRK
ncbi:hypothetical protein [Amycolatopsis sp. FBCC-B4732]|uniref:hypothetical protein n=1 Tax=Amycolatopsis sp. FBCC-B4732 TaxID=3079339 RepID=UPI0028F45C49|nr:hypothetical protein [Amycolatopsis sp. FBCC-B4732]